MWSSANQALLMMTPSITLATSSHLSTAVSITSKISFHLMIWTEFFFFVEQLGDEGAADAVAFIFVAVDLDAMLEGFFRECRGL